MNLRPPSLSGDTHSKDEDVGGGLIIHCDKVAWFCIQYDDVYPLDVRDKDVLITASYLHDISKATLMGYKHHMFNFNGTIVRGYEWSPNKDIDSNHASFSAKEGCKIVKGTIAQDKLEMLYHIIERHMKYKAPFPETELEKLFALADHMMSRKEIGLNWEL